MSGVFKVSEDGKVSPENFLAVNMADLVRINAKMLKILAKPKPKGILYESEITIAAGALQVQLDFEKGARGSANIPTGSSIEFPREKVFQITIRNDGPGTVKFGIPRYIGDAIANITLKEGEHDEMKADEPLFSRLNIVNKSSASAAVRIILML